MHQALLADLHSRHGYPCVSVLFNTTAGSVLGDEERARALALVAEAGRRLLDDVDTTVRREVIDALTDELLRQCIDPCATALGLFAMPGYSTSVRLGRQVNERVVIDETFATRDLVADLHRTAEFRVITVSDRMARSLIGDRHRMVEERNETWPVQRDEQQSSAQWTRHVASMVRTAQTTHRLPLVLAGVDRTVRATARHGVGSVIGTVSGNHDRSGWIDLHHRCWPVVADWLRNDRRLALEALATARSGHRFAGGIDEIWTLATEGRVETLVVEDGYSLAVRIDDEAHLTRVDDPTVPGVIDDIVDEAIEAVLRHGGRTVIVEDGDLAHHDRIAAVLRY